VISVFPQGAMTSKLRRMNTHCRFDTADVMEFLESIKTGSVDAVITDPPYSSGATSSYGRSLPPEKKYVQSGQKKRWPTFPGDTMDQRSWTRWSERWLREALRVSKDDGHLLCFADWRQIGACTDAIQSAGWLWKGVVVWDKTRCARPPHTGAFRIQAEYIIWAVKKVASKDRGGPWDGVYSFPVERGNAKQHLTGKPLDLLRQLVRVCPVGGLVVDPFSGSGTTGVAAIERGCRFAGCEITAHYSEIAKHRIQQAIQSTS
jgi:site-specific DNA-methyltransferase (adenine-specific)